MSPENLYFEDPGSDQTPDMLLGLPCIHDEPGCKECSFLIDHRVVEEYLKYCRLLAYGFCKSHVYILLGSQKTPESSRKVNLDAVNYEVEQSWSKVLLEHSNVCARNPELPAITQRIYWDQHWSNIGEFQKDVHDLVIYLKY